MPRLARRVLFAATLAATALPALDVLAATPQPDTEIRYRTVKVSGLNIFYREAGPKNAPVLLLLHGFPSSSHMFRDLIPRLAAKYRVIAPDYPGFGQSSQPALADFPYTFAALTDVVDGFTQAVGASSYVIYMQDYGGPIGFRLAVKHPERVRGIIVQNAVANVEGWNPDIVKQFAPYWQNRNAETEKPIRAFLTPDTTKFQYTHGATRADRLSPDAWIADQAILDRPGNADVQAQILFNYQDNVANYPAFQTYLKTHRPPMLITFGKNDPFFVQASVDYLKAQVPTAEIHILDAGHFALETHAPEIAAYAQAFLARLPK
jgi:pimeloyl-ACP methyl ester carboxylesterase